MLPASSDGPSGVTGWFTQTLTAAWWLHVLAEMVRMAIVPKAHCHGVLRLATSGLKETIDES